MTALPYSLEHRKHRKPPSLSRTIYPQNPQPAFTLIELLVVITIVGIIASLVVVGAITATKQARRAALKSEIDRLDEAFEQMKKTYGEYPPNCQMWYPMDVAYGHNNLVRYLKKVAPRHREPEDLLGNLHSPHYGDNQQFPRDKPFGIRPSEAIVFWLGGLSDDPNYPISGIGGPSYIVPKFGDPDNRKLDPIENHKRFYPFDVSRLGPRGPDGFFEDSSYNHIEYLLNAKWLRINFWTYTPAKSDQPYLYFDVSRGGAPDAKTTDVPEMPFFGSTEFPGCIYPIKAVSERDANGAPLSFKFANQGRFEILQAGIDNAWGDDHNHLHKWPSQDPAHPDKDEFMPFPGPEYQNYLRVDIDGDGTVSPQERRAVIVYPTGPWIDDLADTATNIGTEVVVEDAK
jgi:prepilin-type N-terminal cleavage/methylation domain-containing protein